MNKEKETDVVYLECPNCCKKFRKLDIRGNLSGGFLIHGKSCKGKGKGKGKEVIPESSTSQQEQNTELETVVVFIQCAVCHQQFQKFDERGCINAEFIAHQNRCKEEGKEFIPESSTSLQKQTTEIHIVHIECAVCHQLYRKFDVRGTINAAFIAHQNRCKGKGKEINPESSTPQQNRRTILPATSPPPPSSSFFNDISNIFDNIDASVLQGLSQQTCDSYLTYLLLPDMTKKLPDDFPMEFLYPVSECVFCKPERDMHQPDCDFLDILEKWK